MPELPLLPHLKLERTASGTAKSAAFPKSAPPETIEHLSHRQAHGEKLHQAIETLQQTWQTQQPEQTPSAPAPASSIPLLIQADAALQPAFLTACEVEIVTDLGNGYLIGATQNSTLPGLQQKIDLFLAEARGGNQVSGVWDILEGGQRLPYILSPALVARWHQLQDEPMYRVDVGIACVGCNPDLPRFCQKQTTETQEQFLNRFERWQTKRDRLLAERQRLQQVRLKQLEDFIQPEGGQVQDVVYQSDSLTCRIQTPGRTLQDLVLNFPYVFAVTEVENVTELPPALALPDAVRPIHGFVPDRLPSTVVKAGVSNSLRQGIRLFLLPSTPSIPVSKTHMSDWAATIDAITAEIDGLFIVPVDTLVQPAESLHALTVGWLPDPDTQTAPPKDEPGIWDTIKPDLVVVAECSIKAGAKVAQLMAEIAATFPNESCLLYRALVVHSARWTPTTAATSSSTATLLCQVGYGIPNLERATHNSPHRITYFTPTLQGIKARQAHVYQIQIPEAVRTSAPDMKIQVDVTLAYKARPARSRCGRSNYLSTWVHWEASKKGEQPDWFLQRTLKEYEDSTADTAQGSFKWAIGTSKRYDRHSGRLSRFSRSSGTLQKDWTQTSVAEIGSAFCIAVIGHAGWDNSPEADAEYTLVVSLEAVEPGMPLYAMFCTA